MLPELLAPVGSEEMCHAAVQNGADAIYAGIPGFNARRREADLSLAEIKKITHYCRLYGVKVYFACNILVSNEELASFETVITPYLELCPDAIIVQDIGLVKWFKTVAPWLPLHASTQMTIASSEAVQMAEEMGISRCVLARELSMKQIKSIRKNCPSMELEVFVHGAMCISYSGQCFASEYFGGRSANRGECAQPCRLPYKFVIDGKVQTNSKPYLLSTSDLCALPVLDELLACGIDSLKIEGRLKSPEYVASVVAAYRSKVNSMESIFSRGFTTGWLKEGQRQCVVSGETSGNRGSFLGRVTKIKGSKVWVKTENECKAGDGILFTRGEHSLGGRVFKVEREGGLLCLEFSREKNFSGVEMAYVNDSPSKEKETRSSFRNKRKIPVSIELSGAIGEALVLKMENIEVRSDFILEKGNISDFDFGLSRTPYICENPVIKVDKNVFVNSKMIRNLRQKAVEKLDETRTARVFPGLCKASFNFKGKIIYASDKKVGIATMRVHQEGDKPVKEELIALKPDFVLVRNLGVLKELQNSGLELRGDYGLNVKNSLSAEYFLQKGITCFCKSPLPIFHTKHCFFAAAFSDNKIYPHCGQPCKRHRLEIEDRYGKRHPVQVDEACRNTVVNTD